jgi:hypothetical protein
LDFLDQATIIFTEATKISFVLTTIITQTVKKDNFVTIFMVTGDLLDMISFDSIMFGKWTEIIFTEETSIYYPMATVFKDTKLHPDLLMHLAAGTTFFHGKSDVVQYYQLTFVIFLKPTKLKFKSYSKLKIIKNRERSNNSGKTTYIRQFDTIAYMQNEILAFAKDTEFQLKLHAGLRFLQGAVYLRNNRKSFAAAGTLIQFKPSTIIKLPTETIIKIDTSTKIYYKKMTLVTETKSQIVKNGFILKLTKDTKIILVESLVIKGNLTAKMTITSPKSGVMKSYLLQKDEEVMFQAGSKLLLLGNTSVTFKSEGEIVIHYPNSVLRELQEYGKNSMVTFNRGTKLALLTRSEILYSEIVSPVLSSFQFDPEEVGKGEGGARLRSLRGLRNRVLSLSKIYLAGSMIVYDSATDITF